MAATYKVLGQAAPSATTETDLYTVPALTQAIVSTIVICNRGGALPTFRVSVSVGGGATANKDYIHFDVQLSGNDTVPATIGVTLGAGDKIRVFASTASFSFSAYGVEMT